MKPSGVCGVVSLRYSGTLLASAILIVPAPTSPSASTLAPSPVDSFDYSSMPSPDGQRIAFVSRRDGNDEIYVMNADGSAQTRLTFSPAADYAPAWSPDGSRISFVSNRDGNTELYVMRADGSAPVNITRHPADDGERHSWSPRTMEIAFASNRDGHFQLFGIHADGSGLRRLGRSSGNDQHPVWSPDGTRIAFDSDRIGQIQVYIADSSGSQATRVTTNSSLNAYPAWSPDGRLLAFISFRDRDGEIYTIGPDGTDERRLTRSRDWDFDPVYAPSGDWITFNSRRDGRRGIYRMRADGSSPRKLTNVVPSEFVRRLDALGDSAGPTLYQDWPRRDSTPPFYRGELGFRATRARTEGRATDALALARTEVRAFPTSKDAYAVLAEVLHAQGRPAPPNDVNFLDLLATDCAQARRVFDNVRRERPVWVLVDPSNVRLVGKALALEGAGTASICAHRLNVHMFPASTIAHRALGDALLDAGDSVAAIASYEQVLSLQPADSATARLLRGLKRRP